MLLTGHISNNLPHIQHPARIKRRLQRLHRTQLRSAAAAHQHRPLVLADAVLSRKRSAHGLHAMLHRHLHFGFLRVGETRARDRHVEVAVAQMAEAVEG